LFIAGSTAGWQKALNKVENEKQYTVILPGHGRPAGRDVIGEDLKYLDFVNKTLASSNEKRIQKQDADGLS